MNALKRYLVFEDGTTAVEYGLIASLVSLAFVAALNQLGVSLPQVFMSIANAISTAVAGGTTP